MTLISELIFVLTKLKKICLRNVEHGLLQSTEKKQHFLSKDIQLSSLCV